ncbi:MAG: hypothetical protein ACI88H_002493 [Cocleimonas sp.]|jgi:hypothetical protein
MSTTKLDEILIRLHTLQDELETELERVYDEKRDSFQYTFNKRKVRFKRKIRDFQRKHKKGILAFFGDAEIKHILSAPVIYSIIFPLVFLDLFVTIYQQICFRLYGIPLVQRNKYIVIDRQHLAYLNVIEKVNCMYCGYGLMSYVTEIIACTEQYWCPIKHASKVLNAHRLTENFTDYGDVEAYQKHLIAMRKTIGDISLIDGKATDIDQDPPNNV